MINRRNTDAMSQWGSDDAARYAVAKHGPDGARFLDPHLYGLLTREQLAGCDFLDLGAGTGPWSKYALDQGADRVTALELNPAMLAKAKELLSREGDLPTNVRLVEGNVASLPFRDQSADRLVSINVGCNLPDGTFQRHFTEAHRVARTGGRFVVTAPDSLTVPFTTGSQSKDIQTEVDERWILETDRSTQGAKCVIASLGSVLRATFVLDAAGKPTLVTEENIDQVHAGAPIIRRIPGLAVDNNYHTAEEYLDGAEQAGWIINAANRESFASDLERSIHNDSAGAGKELGPEYVGNPSFLVMDLERRA